MSNETVPQFSSYISEFCQMIEQAKQDYTWNQEEISRLDKLTQDYLHKLELENLNYNERAKLATQLAKCRRLRRESKDTVEILSPLMGYLETERGKQTANLLKETLGKTRRVEENMKTRTYRYKIIK